MKKTVFTLVLIILLCAAFLKPAILPQVGTSVQIAQKTETHAAWKAQAIQSGAQVCSFEDNVYYMQSDPEHIVEFSDQLAYVDNEVIVFFKDGTTTADKQTLFDSLGAQVVGYTDILNKYQLLLDEEKSFFAMQTLCAKLQAKKNVAFASCNLAMHLTEDDVIPDDPWVSIDPNTGAETETISGWTMTDTNLYGGNWWHIVTQTPQAWEYEKYFQPIKVGILDNGFDTEHEDLQGKISFPSGYHEHTNYPASHGTHVSGIVSANANNKIGITGICDKAELVCVDWSPEQYKQNWSTNERIFTGFIALVKAGAKVINLSLGSSGGFENNKRFFWNISMYMEGALFSYTMASLLSKGYDFLVVQSAGNGAADDEPCDAYYNGNFSCITNRNAFTGLTGIKKQQILDRILVVGSCNYGHNGDRFYQSSFSNYGDVVSLFAPGSWVFSTDLEENGKYSYKSGTSMAAPVVTGIAALTWSVNPKLTGEEVKAILCDPANHCFTATNYYWDEKDIPDYPIVNAELSVKAAVRTLGEPEDPTEPPSEPESETETASTVEANRSSQPFGRTDERIVERLRGEVGE